MPAPSITRRRFIGFAAAALAGGSGAQALAAPRRIRFREVSLDNVHTGEALDAVYWANDYYIPRTMRRVAWVLRDFHSGDVHPIDPKLLDLLARLQEKLRTNEPFRVTSGYRSPRTNAWLAAFNEGVAAHSLHMQGMAVDVSLRRRSLADLHAVALDLQGGGVGYYPAADFVHLDVGPVRRWEFSGNSAGAGNGGGNGNFRVVTPSTAPSATWSNPTVVLRGTGASPAASLRADTDLIR